MLKQYDPKTAKETILKRTPPDEFPVSQRVLDGIAQLFGESLTPEQAVTRILSDVRTNGDSALQNWTKRLDGLDLEPAPVSKTQIQAGLDSISPAERDALEQAAARIEEFHRRQPLTSWFTNDMGGTLGQIIRPIQRVGLYVPGGTAPLPSSVLMSAIPARVAGVKDIVVVTPPSKTLAAEGQFPVSPMILAACAISGVDEVYLLGGAQAVAALAYGTETIPAVDKIFGPGNLFVTLAKRQVYGVVGIDGLAGPTETVVIADESANPAWVAADLLAQAEHDLLASAILLTPSQALIEKVQVEVARQVEQRSRAEIIAASLDNRGGAVLTRDLDEATQLANEYAPEHLGLVCARTLEAGWRKSRMLAACSWVNIPLKCWAIIWPGRVMSCRLAVLPALPPRSTSGTSSKSSAWWRLTKALRRLSVRLPRRLPKPKSWTPMPMPRWSAWESPHEYSRAS